MNKHELRSAYNKIALSDEFKASAKDKLLACFDGSTAGENEQETYVAKAVKLTPQPKKSWKAVAGACAAAAVVGLGVWGAASLMGDTPSITSRPDDTPQDITDDTTQSTTNIINENDPDVSEEVLDEVAEMITDDLMTALEEYYDDSKLLRASISRTELDDGCLIINTHRYVTAYYISDNDMGAHKYRYYPAADVNEVRVWIGEDDCILEYVTDKTGVGKMFASTSYYRIDVDTYELLGAFYDQNGEYTMKRVLAEDSEELTADEYIAEQAKLVEGYTKAEPDADVKYIDCASDCDEELLLNSVRKALGLSCELSYEDDYQATVDANYGEVRMLLDYYRSDENLWDRTHDFYIEGFPEARFVWTAEEVRAIDTNGNEEVLFGGMPIWSVYLTDLNGDGRREICSGVSLGSGIVDDHIVAYDYAAKKLYELSDRGYNDYYLSYSGLAPLMAYERDYASGELTGYCGKLMLDGETLTFERGEDINTAEMKQYTLPVTVMTQSEQGGLTVPQGEEISAEVKFSLPASWESSASTASYAYTKVFEIGAPWHTSEGISTDRYKTNLAYGAEITVLDEKWGTDSDPYEYFIHTSSPIKYAPDGTYDVYSYVVESGGCYATVSVISDMGVKQETIDRVLKSVEITAQDSTEAENDEKDINFTGAYQVYEEKGEVFHIEEMNGGTHAASPDDVKNVQLRFALPYYWVYEPSSYFSGKAYFDGTKIFEYARPLHDDEPIDPDSFKTDFVDGDKVTVHEEKWGTDNGLYEYYIYRSTASEDADDGSFDEYIYIVNSGGYNITLTFAADAGLEQRTIDMILEMVQMECVDPLLYDKPLDINYIDTVLRYRDVEQVGESRFDEYESEWVDYLGLEIELPLSWKYEANTGSIDGVAYYNDRQIFSYERPIKESEGIDTAALLSRTTEGEEKYGTDGDLFEYRLITPDQHIYVVNSGDHNITLTFDANAGISQATIDKVLCSVSMYEYEKCLDAIDGYFPIGGAGTLVHDGVEYQQDVIIYRFVMDEYGNILEDDPENYNHINDYLGALKDSTYIGALGGMLLNDDMRYYLISTDVILAIVPCGEELYSYVDAEELLSQYDADEIFHAYIYERIKG